MRPPVPVVAPLNGATAVGKLCVSAVSTTCRVLRRCWNGPGWEGSFGHSAVTAAPRMALLLSLNLMTLLGLLQRCVPIMLSNRDCGSSRPSTTRRPLKNQWRLCSLLDCAMSKHSTLVGFRPALRKSCV